MKFNEHFTVRWQTRACLQFCVCSPGMQLCRTFQQCSVMPKRINVSQHVIFEMLSMLFMELCSRCLFEHCISAMMSSVTLKTVMMFC